MCTLPIRPVEADAVVGLASQAMLAALVSMQAGIDDGTTIAAGCSAGKGFLARSQNIRQQHFKT